MPPSGGCPRGPGVATTVAGRRHLRRPLWLRAVSWADGRAYGAKSLSQVTCTPRVRGGPWPHCLRTAGADDDDLRSDGSRPGRTDGVSDRSCDALDGAQPAVGQRGGEVLGFRLEVGDEGLQSDRAGRQHEQCLHGRGRLVGEVVPLLDLETRGFDDRAQSIGRVR